MDRDLQLILSNIPEVETARNYWFVRTEGGIFYRAFVEENIVGIGYTKVTVPATDPSGKKKSLFKNVSDQVKAKYPDVQRPGLVARQIITFTNEMKKGDVVIIPGVASQHLTFGIIKDDAPKDTVVVIGEDNRFDRKVRKVQWMKTVRKKALNPNLFSLFLAHQTISNGNEYAGYIDSTLHDFFIKDGKAHLQLPVQRAEDINARHLFKSCMGLLDLADSYLHGHSYTENTSDVEVKININSPGVIEFIGQSAEALGILGLIIVGLCGGGFKAKFGEKEVELKTEGLIASVSKFLDGQAKRKTLMALVDELKMQDSKDIKEVVKKLVE